MKQIISIFILTSILFSCKKSSTGEEEYYTIEGLVLDYDSKTVIAAAKVYKYQFCCGQPYLDSAVSDVNGRVSFICKKEGDYKLLTATKNNYLHPLKYANAILAHISRIDTVYLARPSYVQLTVHKTNTYQPSDSVEIWVHGDYFSPSSGHTYNYRILLKDKADSPDKMFSLYTFYEPVNYTKLEFYCRITRNGAIISEQYTSTNLIQFWTQNYTLNY